MLHDLFHFELSINHRTLFRAPPASQSQLSNKPRGQAPKKPVAWRGLSSEARDTAKSTDYIPSVKRLMLQWLAATASDFTSKRSAIPNRMETIVTRYADYASDIRLIREAVFIEEQSVSRNDEFDGLDDRCIHAVCFDNHHPLGTGRLDLAKHGKIGRVAVLAEYRRRGIGKRIMQALENAAWESGAKSVWFHAQLQAVPFYESLGYVIEGEKFVEANIVHVRMSRMLAPPHKGS